MERQWRCIGTIHRGPAVKLIHCSVVQYRRGSKSTCGPLHKGATIGTETPWHAGWMDRMRQGRTGKQLEIKKCLDMFGEQTWHFGPAPRGSAARSAALALFFLLSFSLLFSQSLGPHSPILFNWLWVLSKPAAGLECHHTALKHSQW